MKDLYTVILFPFCIFIIALIICSATCDITGKETTPTEILTEAETTAIETTTEETTTETTTEPTTEAKPEWYPFEKYEVEALAQMVYGEAQTSPREQKRWVAIVALNHLDRHCNNGYSLYDIVTDRNQFVGYNSSNPITDEIWNICIEVIKDYPTKTNWVDYYYFNSVGDGINNYFH